MEPSYTAGLSYITHYTDLESDFCFFSEYLHIIIIPALSSAEFALCVGVVVHLPAVFADLQRYRLRRDHGSIGKSDHGFQAANLPHQLRIWAAGQPIAEKTGQIHNPWIGCRNQFALHGKEVLIQHHKATLEK